MIDTNKLNKFCETQWDESILPAITEYIRIPNKSPTFDPKWAEHGHMDKAVALMETWAREKIAAVRASAMQGWVSSTTQSSWIGAVWTSTGAGAR